MYERVKYQSHFFELVYYCDYATYTAYPYIALVQRDKSDGKLKAKDIYTGTAFISKKFDTKGAQKIVSDTNPFGLSGYHLAAVNEGDGVYPVVDRTSAIVAGPFFGTGGVIKPRDDLALRYAVQVRRNYFSSGRS